VGVALCLTAFVFALAIRDVLHVGRAKAGWLFTSALLHGWPWIALDVFFYAYLCWLAFWCVRGTAGTERIFMLGWFVGILISPLRMLRPDWAVAIKHVAAIGLAVAVLAALALLLRPPTPQGDST